MHPPKPSARRAGERTVLGRNALDKPGDCKSSPTIAIWERSSRKSSPACRFSIVPVGVVHVRHMRMRMAHWLMFVKMRVRFSRWIIRPVGVAMVLIVNVGVRMTHCLVKMFVFMTLT